MDRRAYGNLVFGPINSLEAKQNAATQRMQFRLLAELQAPREVSTAYAKGLDAVEQYGRGGYRNFHARAGDLVTFMQRWQSDVGASYKDYAAHVTDPEFALTIEDLMRAVKWTTNPSATKILLDIAKQLGLSAVRTHFSIKAIANYLDALNAFQNKVSAFVIGDLEEALRRDGAM